MGRSSIGHHFPSHERLLQLFETTPEVICCIDEGGRFTTVSAASEQLWGYRPEELIGRSFLELVLEEDRTVTEEVISNIRSGVSMMHFINRYRHKNGSIIPVVWSAYWDTKQKTMICVARYSHEEARKDELQAFYKEELDQQNRLLRDILERITDGFVALDASFLVTYWNKQAEVILGLSREDALHKNIWELYPEAVGTDFYFYYNKAFNQQIPVKFIAFFNPHSAWYEVNVYPSADGISVFFQNITERKNMEKQLSRLHLIIEQTNNIVVLTDRDGKITWVNPAFTHFTEYSLEEAYGHKPGELLQGPDTDPAVVAFMHEKIQREESFTAEVLNYKKSKARYWMQVFCQPLYNENGTLEGFFAIQADITERKQMEQALNEQQKKINVAIIATQEKERAQVSQELHDNINQILTTVKLYNELCRDGVGNTTEIMNKSVQLLQKSINDIRNLSKRLSAPTLSDVRLKDSVKELIDTVAATNKITVSLNFRNDIDPEVSQEIHLALYRILQEHITNVLRHSGASNVSIIIDLIDNTLVLQVIDDGVGFDPSEKRRGIGITNMITRAESANGSLTIKSTPGKGCELTVHLPLNRQ